MITNISMVDGKWYAFGVYKDHQVVSIGRDCTAGGTWVARMTDNGIKYVATPSPTKAAAIAKARRHGEYMGIL